MLNDHSKWFVAKTVFLNNRMSAYKAYIRYAQEKGYQVISLEDFYNLSDRRIAGERHFVLRHDVDHPGISTRKMFDVERECGVTSNYYFRFSTIDKPLIADMKQAGFQVGLHFETISDYIKEKGCTDKREIDIDLMRRRLTEDIKRFEDIVGFKTVSCCSHGDPVNKKLGISNNAIVEGADMTQFGLMFEAYDARLYETSVDCHVMDRTILFNYGFAYRHNPYEAINQAHQNIVFLSHPHNWYSEGGRYFKDIIKLILGRATYSTDSEFVRIRQ